jgi:septal ring factor EnvC (AmiA/AmiB activator)
LVGIDHGLGVVSIYANLESVNVRKGDTVSRGDAIGQAGSSGFAASPQIYVELRVQGEPVDAEEWIDPGRYHYLFAARIEELKRQLGIPIARRLE